MTFPVVSATNGEHGTSLAAAGAIAAPTNIAAGHLLLGFIVQDNGSATNIAGSTGWHELFNVTQGSNVVKMACYARIADETADDTLTPTGAAQDYCATLVRITNHAVTDVTGIKVSTTSGASGSADSPSLDAGVSGEYLWVAAACLDSSSGTQITADPANYTNVDARVSSVEVTSCALRVSQRSVIGQTEDPAIFTNATRPWIAVTLAIPGLSDDLIRPAIDTARLAPNYRRRTKLIQPNFNRTRVPYRSPMSSHKMNLEAEQLRFDLSNLRALTERFKTSLENDLLLTKNGGSATGVHSGAVTDTHFAEPLYVISGKIKLLRDRVRRLEITKGINQ